MTHNGGMRSRRFLLLAAVLVAINTALWIVPQGLALRQVVVATLFGKSMVRADVVESSGAEWRVDRGVVVSNVPGTLTIQEADGRVQPIVTSAATKITGAVKLKAVKPGWRVLVTWPAPAGPADQVTVEKRAAG
jgi:hypothetical protein